MGGVVHNTWIGVRFKARIVHEEIRAYFGGRLLAI
jgi:hypothetical protein